MWTMLKKYWDIIGGIASGLLLTLLAEFELERVQLIYSIIILILVSIGIFRIIKQAIDKQREKRKHTVIDSMVDSQKSIKAIRLAQEPTKDGEKMGELLIKLWEVKRTIMNKVKEFFDKFKGYILTILLAVLTVIEMCSGVINSLCGGVLTVNGIEILPLITLGCTTIVGIISNGYTSEQQEKIKALFSKSTTNELVAVEIKKTIKEKSTQLSQFNKLLSTKEHELANIESELETLKNTLQAKREMCNMTPKLATLEDVQLANNAVVSCEAKVSAKKKEIEETKTSIKNLTTTIDALKSQL